MSKLKNKKLSEKILELIEPYMSTVAKKNSEARMESLVLIGSTAWNIEVTGKKDLQDVIFKTLSTQEEISEIKKTINELIERKQKLFPDDDRLILNYKINPTKNKMSDLTVSFLNKDEYEGQLK
ncbi:MAG: hypothetical protein GQ569_11170 [Methylococcaceae bacterium]|nr:hypothetical protein [Methylococcaceae bacterium]